MTKNYKRVKFACYMTSFTMSVIGNLSPLLFLTFRESYGISYSLLGLLVLVNFVTQLSVDLVFSFLSHKFNIPLAVKLTPAISIAGLLIFASSPLIFAGNEYVGMIIGTVIFSAAGGLGEVLISPVIAAIPAENPDREMSKLHSVYAWGTVGVIILGTLFLKFVGGEFWWVLALIFALVPAVAVVAFLGSELPPLETPERASGVMSYLRQGTLWLFVIGIFCGGAAECTMAQWSSGYLEGALGIPKIYGDIFGVALFALTLGLGRTLYSKFGKRIYRVLILGTLASAVCYAVAALSPIPFLGLVACALTGFATSMLWPGSLIAASDRFPTAGVFLYALMAAGGDLGASVAPQLLGIITDTVSTSTFGANLALDMAITSEQLGMKLGMLVGVLFSLIGALIFTLLYKKCRAEHGKA